jgi:hypothetical protein
MAILPRPVPTTATKSQLLAEIANLDGIITSQTSQIGALNAQVSNLNSANAALTAANATLTTSNAALAAERDDAVAALQPEIDARIAAEELADSYSAKAAFHDAVKPAVDLYNLLNPQG